MGVIFVISGKSGVGKDTIMAKLLANESLNLEQWVMSTTRPMRPGEVDGREYHFVSTKDFESDLASGKVVEYRTYQHFKNNGAEYPVTYYEKDDLDPNKNYIIANPPNVCRDFTKYFEDRKDFMVVSIYISLDPVTRFKRMFEREEQKGSNQYAEVGRRFLADEEDYGAEENVKKDFLIDYQVENYDLNECLKEMKMIIFANNFIHKTHREKETEDYGR